jgi:hypothetical protein
LIERLLLLVNTDVLGPAECKEKVGAKFARPFSLSTLLSGEGKIAEPSPAGQDDDATKRE